MRFSSLPEYRRFKRSNPYDEAVQMIEVVTMYYTRTVIGCGLLGVAVAYWVGVRGPSWSQAFILTLPWMVIGTAYSFVLARRVLRAPMLYSQPMRLIMEIMEEGLSWERERDFAQLNRRYWFVTNKRDTVAIWILMLLWFVTMAGGAHTFLLAPVLFATAMHLSWYAWKRWYLTARIRQALETTQVVFRLAR